jgi:hypothetical protein
VNVDTLTVLPVDRGDETVYQKEDTLFVEPGVN